MADSAVDDTHPDLAAVAEDNAEFIVVEEASGAAHHNARSMDAVVDSGLALLVK